MNNKGQSFFLFILLIPVFIMVFGALIEFGYIQYNKTKLSSVTNNILSNNLSNYTKDDIISLYSKNNIEIKDLTFEKNSIFVSEQIDSLLGNIIGKDYYIIKYEK